MSKHTTFKVGGLVKNLLNQKLQNKIFKLFNYVINKILYFVIGNGSNLLVSDNGYYGVVIHIEDNNFSQLKVIKKDEDYYSLIGVVECL